MHLPRHHLSLAASPVSHIVSQPCSTFIAICSFNPCPGNSASSALLCSVCAQSSSAESNGFVRHAAFLAFTSTCSNCLHGTRTWCLIHDSRQKGSTIPASSFSFSLIYTTASLCVLKCLHIPIVLLVVLLLQASSNLQFSFIQSPCIHRRPRQQFTLM